MITQFFLILAIILLALLIIFRIFLNKKPKEPFDPTINADPSYDLKYVLSLASSAYFGAPSPQSRIDQILQNRYDKTSKCFGRFEESKLELIKVLNELEELIKQMQYDPSLEAYVIQKLEMHAEVLESKMPFKQNVYPWSTNWYEFSIQYPTIFMNYIIISDRLNKTRQQSADWLPRVNRFCDIILKLNPKPNVSSFSRYERTGPNLIKMATVHYFAKLALGVFKIEDVKNESFVRCIQQYYPEKYKELKSGKSLREGMYEDNTLVFHRNLRAFGYLLELLVGNEWLFLPLAKYTKIPDIHLIVKDVMHPKINRIAHSFTNRNGYLDRFRDTTMIRAEGLPHLKWFSIGKMASCLYDNYVLQYLCANPLLAAFEYDVDHLIYSASWIFSRRMHTNDTISKIEPKFDKYEPGVLQLGDKYFKEIQTFPRVRSTTTVCLDSDTWSMCVQEKSVLATLSYVHYKNYKLLDYTVSMPDGLIRIFILPPALYDNIDVTLSIGHGKPTAENGFDKIKSKFLKGNVENETESFEDTYIGYRSRLVHFTIKSKNHIYFGYANNFVGTDLNAGTTFEETGNGLIIYFTNKGRPMVLQDNFRNNLFDEKSHKLSISYT